MANVSKGIQKTLVGNQRYQLFKFVEKYPTTNETYEELAKLATAELGITITRGCLEHHWIAVHGKRHERGPRKNTAAIESRITQIEAMLKTLIEKGIK